jgi:hypothetical protein
MHVFVHSSPIGRKPRRNRQVKTQELRAGIQISSEMLLLRNSGRQGVRGDAGWAYTRGTRSVTLITGPH